MMETKSKSKSFIETQDNFYTPRNRNFYSNYQYSDLDTSKQEIRLVQLFSVKDDEPLQLTLVGPFSLPLDLSKSPSYCAVSYVAGNHEKTTEIFVNNVRFNAFANLAHALRQIIQGREGDELHQCPRLLWVDQICINQSKPAERSHQVGLMRQIFESAAFVLASLGDNQSNDHWVKTACRLKAELSKYENPPDIEVDETTLYIENHPFANFHGKAFQTDWNSLGEIIQSPWWRRGWITQEVLVAREIFLIFGQGILDWDSFAPATYICNGAVLAYLRKTFTGRIKSSADVDTEKLLAMGGWASLPSAMMHNRLKWQKKKAMDIKELLNLSRVCDTTDVRDRVFAFIGLADPGYQISPDYTIESRDLFRFACKRIIVYETRLNILCFCGESYKKNDKRQDSLPSWVPEWSRLSVFLAYNPARDALPFRASADYRSAAAFRPNKGLPDSILRVQCLFVDQIGTQNSHPMSTSDQALDEWRLLAGLQDKYESSRSKTDIPRYRYNDSLTVEDVFMKVIRKGIFTGNKTPEYAENIVLNSLDHGRFFRSMKGYIGIAELRTHDEDHICVLLGANIPLMLRQVGDHFMLVGQAYVEGLMYGEAIEMMKRGELEVETIDIY